MTLLQQCDGDLHSLLAMIVRQLECWEKGPAPQGGHPQLPDNLLSSSVRSQTCQPPGALKCLQQWMWKCNSVWKRKQRWGAWPGTGTDYAFSLGCFVQGDQKSFFSLPVNGPIIKSPHSPLWVVSRVTTWLSFWTWTPQEHKLGIIWSPAGRKAPSLPAAIRAEMNAKLLPSRWS